MAIPRIDILDYLAMADQSKGLPFSRQTHGLNNANDIITPIDSSGYGQWKHIKSPSGFPWDLKLYDEFGVYDWVTEKTWAEGPRCYKKFVQNRIDRNQKIADGLQMCDRFYQNGIINSGYLTPHLQSTYRIYTDCKWDNKPNNLSDVNQAFFGPVMLDHGGDVGLQSSLIQQYEWNGHSAVYGMIEENWYALNYGWTRWVEKKLNPATGVYEITKNAKGGLNMSISNKLVKRSPSVVNFPCF